LELIGGERVAVPIVSGNQFRAAGREKAYEPARPPTKCYILTHQDPGSGARDETWRKLPRLASSVSACEAVAVLSLSVAI